MNDEHKHRHQLIEELAALRQRVADLESAEAERQCLEETLRESQERLSKLMTIAPVGIFLTDPQGRCTFVNQRWREMAGISLEQSINEDWMDWLHPEDREQVAAAWNKMIESEGKWSLEYRYQTPEGQVTWVLGYATALHDRLGRLTGYIGTNIDITERKRAEEAYRALVDYSLQGLCIASEGRIVFANAALAETFGYTVEELLSLTPDQMVQTIHPQDRPFFLQFNRDWMAGQDFPPRFELRVLHQDGSVHWTEQFGTLIEYQGKRALQIAVRDITERKRAEKAIREREAQLHSLIESLPFDIFALDESGRCFLQNSSSRENWGDVTGLRPHDVASDPATLELWQENDQRAFAGETVKGDVMFPIRGEKRFFTNIIAPIRDKERIIGIVGSNIDITERRRAEHALRESEERYRSTIDAVEDSIHVVDRDLKLVLYNQAMRTIISKLGIDGDLIGKKLQDAFPFLPPRVQQEYEQILETGDSLITEEMTLIEERPMWTETRKIPLLDEEGRPFRIITIIRDTTERKQAEEQLRQYAANLQRSNRELEQFAYIASHDLQEPLRMIASYLQLLKQEFGDQLSAEADEFIHYAADSAARMQEMVKALLTYSRVDTGGRAFEPVDCESILKETLLDLQIAIEGSDALVTHDPLPTVMADGVQLGEVFQNLIGNALKFRGDEPPQIHVSAALISPPRAEGAGEERPEWLFSVGDNGIGIDPQHSQRIFEIFQRLHTRDEYEGTGFGLALCKKIVERHGGRIWVESKPGQGSTFYFTLPKG